jgi:hypothetical protein
MLDVYEPTGDELQVKKVFMLEVRFQAPAEDGSNITSCQFYYIRTFAIIRTSNLGMVKILLGLKYYQSIWKMYYRSYFYGWTMVAFPRTFR